jgi:hypothetical protein
MGNLCIGAGLVGLVIIAIGFLVTNPARIRAFRETLQNLIRSAGKSTTELEGLRNDLKGTRVPADAPADDRFADLRIGEMVELALKEAGRKIEVTLTAHGIFHGLNRRPNSQIYSRRGEEWSVWVFENNIMIIRRPEGYFGFTIKKRVAVSPEGGEKFNKAGEVFSHEPYMQEARSYTFKAQGIDITVVDVGYFEVETRGGTLPSPDAMKVKYLLGEDPQGNTVLFTNNFVGTDYFWADGVFMGESIEPYIGAMTRAMA